MSYRIDRVLYPCFGLCAALVLASPVAAEEVAERGEPPAEQDELPVEPTEPPVDPEQPAAAEANEPSVSEEQVAIARRRFARGVELASEGDFARAARHFEEALAIRDAPPVRFNLASALYELESYVESYNHLLHLLEVEDLDPEVRLRAERLEDGLRDHVGTLTVTVGGEEGMDVVVDGEPLPVDRLGRQFAVPPGDHVVEAYRDDEVVSRRQLEVQPRTRAHVDMQVVASPREAAAQADSAPLTSTESRESTGGPKRFGLKDWRLWAVVGGVLVAAAGVAVGVGLASGGGGGDEPIEGNFDPAVVRFP